MDESPRWLIVNGQHDSALRVLQKAARWNNATIPLEEDLRDLMRNIQDESSTPLRELGTPLKKVGRKKLCGFLPVPSLLSTRAITIVTLVMCFDYFVVSLVFDGLNLSGDNYSADPFLYIVLGGLMEVPGYSLTALIINRWGRRTPTALSYILCGLVILVLTFIPNEVSWLAMTLAMAGKMSISGAFQIISIYSSELFPTKVRLQGIGASSEFSQLASTVLPYITTYLGTFIPWVPSVIFGCLSMMAGLATLALHETMGIALPDTISDLSSTVKRTLKNKTDDDEDLEKENLRQ
ncbi:organic cation transporter protein-like [Homarus americanus]|uniref:organic cation transporter protein-like n=1 Tax=Homarus americanus TaxID=6706 RepID=UPI001C48C697|nr:organic cation transporter protein-like [Homarus americanus]